MIVDQLLEGNNNCNHSINEDKVCALTKDHKPSEEGEKKRILEAGGQIYQ